MNAFHRMPLYISVTERFINYFENRGRNYTIPELSTEETFILKPYETYFVRSLMSQVQIFLLLIGRTVCKKLSLCQKL